MEPTYNQHPTPQQDVGFPPPPPRKEGSKSGKVVVAIIGVLLILGIGGYFLYQSVSESGSASPTPDSNLTQYPTPSAEPSREPTPSATPEPVDKADVSIEVLNGTGTPGEASYLQQQLEDLGFEDITAGNADSQDATETSVTFSREMPDDVVDEITGKLESIYQKVTSTKGSLSGDTDIRITTGPRKGSSATATKSPSPSSSPTASPESDE